MSRIFYSAVLLMILLLPSVRSIAQDDSMQNTGQQHECGNRAIVAAIGQYDIGKFNECISGLKMCIDRNGFDYNEMIQAYRLTAMSYLAIDSVKEANAAIERLVTIDENFELDVRDPQRFRLQVAFIRTQMRANLTSSVSKKMENIDLAPATIQIITAKDIQDRGYIDIESIFSDLPGFDVTRNFGISYSVLYQRGYRSPALTERTMIMVDGIEDNDLWTNAAFISKQYPVSSVKRIEVIYGPASTIYGANAFCGVINIVTKDEDDLFSSSNSAAHGEKPKNMAINLQTGAASYGTKYIDGTLGLKNKNVVFSLTGRMYVSDGVKLSDSQPYWDGVPDYGDAAYKSKMTLTIPKGNKDSIARYVGQYFSLSADSTKIIPTAAGIKRADSMDKARYKTALKNANLFSNPISDFFISGKLSVSNFKFGFQYWNKNEGSVGDYIDNYASPNGTYTHWQVREYNMYARYDKKLSDHFNITSLTYYRYCDFGDGSKVATFSGYGNGGLTDYQFLKNASPKYGVTNYFEASNMVNTELKTQYVINDKFDIVAGSDFRSGIIQANYLTSSVYAPAQIYGHAPDSAGGNNIIEYTISGYATGSFKDVKRKLNIDLGGRVDNNQFREHQGYGTVFNPRVDIVYYPGHFIFKAIYAEAFLDASNQNKFSTASSRLLNNPTLDPERVKNVELSARYKFHKKNYVEVSAYRADYSHSLALVAVTLPNKVVTKQYQDIGQSLVYGLQAASEIFVGEHVAIYANLTYTEAKSKFAGYYGGNDSSVTTGDIAPYSANAGVNIGFFQNKLNLNTRVNIVADKPTGKGTSVAANPYTQINGYQLLNATLGYRVIKNILVQVGCNNILNTSYYSPGVRAADNAVYAPRVLQPTRNFMARVIFDLKK